MNLAKLIDHTILKPVASKEDVAKICQEAREYGFCSVCVNPYWVSYAKELLQGTDVKVCTVIGFPLGANTSAVKAYETQDALKNGAEEIDMVINLGALKSKDYDTVLNDIKAVRAACEGFILKVIIETSQLTEEEKVKACELSAEAKADFVKTSTGFTGGGATAPDVALMKKSIPAEMQVKASGGVRSREDFDAMVAAGATRIGASSGVKIVEGK
ncbi:MAG: deoxyribose-phosphate aldolase [Elusimicrobiaceae bacterium]|uniref:Deoxyribose-phosphate aldolase n=1 Tax=Candidatus Avelusimicrobium gallicola TaxID=2562704 RepID=A0A928HFQ6_9BACT|nr:deoxyribose-phosphate aldolase [Elusimicrobium sp.]MBQ9971026.1 deoxyribose-phosphate aldolase [Elusimicrobiaceae bacterium]